MGPLEGVDSAPTRPARSRLSTRAACTGRQGLPAQCTALLKFTLAREANQIDELVAEKSRTLVRRMVAQLEAAAKDHAKTYVAIGLLALHALLRERRHPRLRLAARWPLRDARNASMTLPHRGKLTH